MLCHLHKWLTTALILTKYPVMFQYNTLLLISDPIMEFYDDFYYEKELSDSQYGDVPTSVWNLTRLIQQKPYWKKYQGKTKRYKKTLIFETYLTLGTQSIEERTVMACLLLGLQGAGFKIKLFYNNNLHPLILSLLFLPPEDYTSQVNFTTLAFCA